MLVASAPAPLLRIVRVSRMSAARYGADEMGGQS